MALEPGTKIGPYEIVAHIGKGGMGDVWSALDSRLNRNVAIKVSAEQFSDRFGREARAIASLNHPNICTLFDVGPNYLVMELVEGPTLAERIAQGPIPVEEALAIARQLADALEAAHDKGIVHRDLKPANIKLRNDGSVKVLDFGLAKTGEPAEVTANSPTMLSATGIILGTAGYMSPEQAAGKIVDKRADIWAFGVVLYEMVTGERAFAGETVSETLAEVIKGEPDWTKVPARLLPLLRWCLEKDPKKRLRDISGVELLLSVESAPQVVSRRSPLTGWIAAAAAALAAAGVLFVHLREVPLSERTVFSTIALPENSALGDMALSPDGRRLAGVVQGQISLRSIDSPEFQPLANTTGARYLFWSPDGRSIGFTADGKLKTIPVSGGPARSLCDSRGGTGTWNKNGIILFSEDRSQAVRRVNAAGGSCDAIEKMVLHETHDFPVFLPDSRHYLYTVNADDESRRGIYVASLDDPAGRRVLNDLSGVLYAPPAPGSKYSHLLFMRETTLMAQPFDDGKLEPAGDPWPVSSQASFAGTPWLPAATVSTNGILAFAANRANFDGQLVWFDRGGKELGKVGTRHDQRSIALSTDGKTVATMRRVGDTFSIWLNSVAGDSESRLVDNANTAVWASDGKKAIYGRGRDLLAIDSSGGGQELPVSSGVVTAKFAADWSHDGRFLIYTEIDSKTLADIWYMTDPLKAGGSTPVKFLATNADEGQPQFSPDGHWVAYTSNESGKNEVYVRPFPSGSGQWKVSANGGVEPRWSAGGKEIYYIGTASRPLLSAFIAVSIKPNRESLEIGSPQKLFEARTVGIVPRYSQFRYSVASDGRFLVNTRAETAEPSINLITNWQKLPGAKE